MRVADEFAALCRNHGMAATHQRRVIYDTVVAMHGHPSPELIYDKVRKKIPSISLATVYNNVRTFLESGMLRAVSMHHGSLRVEPTGHQHHHLVCVRCKSINDIDAKNFGPLRLRNHPRGFRVTRIAVDVLGVCAACAAKEASK